LTASELSGSEPHAPQFVHQHMGYGREVEPKLIRRTALNHGMAGSRSQNMSRETSGF
jgi:hypothetical protein